MHFNASVAVDDPPHLMLSSTSSSPSMACIPTPVYSLPLQHISFSFTIIKIIFITPPKAYYDGSIGKRKIIMTTDMWKDVMDLSSETKKIIDRTDFAISGTASVTQGMHICEMFILCLWIDNRLHQRGRKKKKWG